MIFLENLPKIKYDTIELKRLCLSLQQEINKQQLEFDIFDQNPISVDLWKRANDIVVRFNKNYVCKNQEKEIYFEFPKTWIDHFKIQHKNNWLMKKWLKKHPFQLNKHKYDITKNTVFPDFIYPIGDRFKEYFIMYQIKEKGDLFG